MTYTNVILVDKNDQIIGEEEKLAAHEKGLLHRAFSIFVYKNNADNIELLMQKRAPGKYHCPNLWTNSCCSHPTLNNDILTEVKERLQFEMGMDVNNIQFIDKFTYKVGFSNGLTEHEIDHVFVSEYNGAVIKPNPDEVCDFKWISIDSLEQELRNSSEKFSPWLAQVLNITKKNLEKA